MKKQMIIDMGRAFDKANLLANKLMDLENVVYSKIVNDSDGYVTVTIEYSGEAAHIVSRLDMYPIKQYIRGILYTKDEG